MTGAGGDPAALPTGVRGVGTDAVDVARFRATLDRRPSLAGRLFSDEERARAAERRDPVPTLAARFAAKEAVLKVLGVGLGAFDWRDVSVGALPTGQPVLHLSGRAAALAEAAGVGRWHLSLTHTDTVAIATVVAEGAGVAASGGPGPAGGAVAPAGAGDQDGAAGGEGGATPPQRTEGACSRS